MMSDSDLLAMLKSLGGQLVRHQSGEFWAVFENEYQSVVDGMVESSGPALTARTIDVQSLAKDVVLPVKGAEFRIKRHEPDGTGVTVLLLKL
jgi:hypothetical protein